MNARRKNDGLRRTPWAAAACAFAVLVCGAASGAGAADAPARPATKPAAALPVKPAAPEAVVSNSAASVETVRTLLSKWVETEQLSARESREAEQSKDILAARIEVLKEGIAALNEKLEQSDQKLALAQSQKSAVTRDIDQVTVAITQLADEISGLESGLRTLHPRLPAPLTENIRTLYERMPVDTNNVRVSVAERCQNVLGVLNAINKFHSEISVVFDVRTLSDGKPSEVSCVYVGLGQAYSVSPRGEAAVGRPGPQGWTWTPVPASSEAIALTMEILQSKAKPKFVPLPVELE